MIRAYRRLPGPAWVRVALLAVAAVVVVALRVLAYGFLGRWVLDRGGVIG